ncbi:hypothetical protein Tco_1418619 [Tanacetum coccineum]
MNVSNVTTLVTFARNCTVNGTHDSKEKRDSLYQQQETGKQEKIQMGLLTMDDGIVNWGEHIEAEETNHALMAISSSNEMKKLKRYRRIRMKAVKKGTLQKTGFEIQSNNEVLSFEEEMNFSVFKCSKEDSIGKPSYSRFTKTNDFKGVPHPLSGDYTPKPKRKLMILVCLVKDLVKNTLSTLIDTEIRKNSMGICSLEVAKATYLGKGRIRVDTLSVLGKFDKKSDEDSLGISEETNSACTSQTPESIASEEKDEEVELIVMPSAVKIPKEKDESRTSSQITKI